MPHITAIINQKGGVGKSTTALALGAGLALRGQRILFVDLDAQGNLSHTLGVQNAFPTVYEILLKQATAQAALVPVAQGQLLPSSPLLAGMDAVLTDVGKEFRLREALQPIKDSFDTILLDTPPQLGILSVGALTAADSLIIPAQADVYSLQGIGQLQGTIETVRQYCNPGLTIQGILLTRYNPRAVLSREIAEMTVQIAEQLGTRCYDTTIREAIAVKEAQASQQDLFAYAPGSKVAGDYSAFMDEYLHRRDA